jgi:hypothetical protein
LAQPNQHQPQHTLTRHNGQLSNGPNGRSDALLNLPFSYLPHPDRQLTSPMELLLVSAYKPALLTQRFPSQALPPNGGTASLRHYAPWLVDAPNNPNRLFRFFEFVETSSRASGVARGGRIPGLINLNTVWDPEILLALGDPQPSNYFVDPDIYKPLAQDSATAPQSIYWRLMASRSPSLLASQSPSYRGLDFKDQPFLGNAPGVSPAGDVQHPLRGTGIGDSLLRNVVAGTGKGPLFQTTNDITSSQGRTGVTSAYIVNELMGKLFNNVTTRSNMFAVWVTVGFFQVTDDQARPVKLGAEIGKAEGRNIRHRMFAIVDRSSLTVDNQGFNTGPPIFLAAKLETTTVIQGVTRPVYSISGAQYPGVDGPNTLSGYYEGIPWSIKVGTVLQAEPATLGGSTQFPKVHAVNGPGATFTNLFGQQVTVSSPSITLKGQLGAGTPSPLYMMVPVRNGQPIPPEVKLGNPGPKPGFNPRNYPWIVRYFSIIH